MMSMALLQFGLDTGRPGEQHDETDDGAQVPPLVWPAFATAD